MDVLTSYTQVTSNSSNLPKQGDILIVGLNSDASVKRLKAIALNLEQDRISLLKALRVVDFVVVFEQDTYSSDRGNSPDVLVKGADYLKVIVGQAEVESWGEVKLCPL